MTEPTSPAVKKHPGPWAIEVYTAGRWQEWRVYSKGKRREMEREWSRLKLLKREVRVQTVMFEE